MTDTEREWDDSRINWNHLGRAAERFARRLARDAGRFAEKVQEHTGEFADEVSRDWSRAHGCAHRGRGEHHAGPEVRHIFEDIRGVLTDIIDGVDELIARVFQEPGGDDTAWVRMVTNRDLVCAACERPLKAGDEAYVRRGQAGIEARCLACGKPAEEAREGSDA